MIMGRVFAIKKFALHDGPNIRTTIFFKGCPLRCAWCHNPEGMSPKIEPIWDKDRCAGCGQCLDECKAGALSLENGRITRDTGLCVRCGHCVDICPAMAHEATGQNMEVDDIMKEIKKDIPFYDQSGGGVTFSGGEPLLQPRFLLKLLRACGNLKLHRTLDTCAHVKTDLLAQIADQTDLFLIDIKHMDSEAHKQFTGVPNGLILENIRFFARLKNQIRFRIPLIDGVNSDPDNIEKTGRFISKTAPGSRVDLLPYHEMAWTKYHKLGMRVSSLLLKRPDNKALDRCAGQLAGFGLDVTIGG
jgi:pyruvate formate lyase activating enzyme